MVTVFKYLFLALVFSGLGFFVGNVHSNYTRFEIPYYPTKYSGIYGIDKPCPEDSNDRKISLSLIETYRVEKKQCWIKSVEKVDGYYELHPGINCVEFEDKDTEESYSQIRKDIKPFEFSFKPIGEGKISVRIDGQPDQIFTKCHLLREMANENR